jgi:hypothetical protein
VAVARSSARSRLPSTARDPIDLVVQPDLELGLESVDQDVDRFAALPPVEDGTAEFVRDGDALAHGSAGGWPAPQDIPRRPLGIGTPTLSVPAVAFYPPHPRWMDGIKVFGGFLL